MLSVDGKPESRGVVTAFSCSITCSSCVEELALPARWRHGQSWDHEQKEQRQTGARPRVCGRWALGAGRWALGGRMGYVFGCRSGGCSHTHLEDITHVLVQFLDVFHPPLELELVELYTHAFASLRVAVSSRMVRHRQRRFPVRPHPVSATAELLSHCQHSATHCQVFFPCGVHVSHLTIQTSIKSTQKWLEPELWNEIGKQVPGRYPAIELFGVITPNGKSSSAVVVGRTGGGCEGVGERHLWPRES